MIDIMKLLNGADIADFIKERQIRQVRNLRQSHAIAPHLAIIRTNPDPVVDSYMKLKKTYGEEMNIDVTVHTIDQSEAIQRIKELNLDNSVHGIIVQIPLPDPSQTDEILNAVIASKDVDGLAAKTQFDPPTPIAITWLLAGYNIELSGKTIAVVGQGRLVGAPLTRIWELSNYTVIKIDRDTTDVADKLIEADIIVSATGIPGLITQDMLKPKAVIVDAGVATDSNGLIGDVSTEVRVMPDISITPEKGGVGPLTVCALFENVIKSAQATVGS